MSFPINQKLHTEALLEVLSKAIAEEINRTLAYFDPTVQVHSCYLNNPREKLDCNFDNAFHCRPQVIRQMSRVGLKWVGTFCLSSVNMDMPIQCHDFLRNYQSNWKSDNSNIVLLSLPLHLTAVISSLLFVACHFEHLIWTFTKGYEESWWLTLLKYFLQ